ncbi:MAG: hypothetical protein ACI8PZ_002024 [Myxococcota bacterium]|jgi:hypothetical protein
MWLPMILVSMFATAPVAAPSFPLEMELEYCYEGSPCGYAMWTFFADGTVEDDLDGQGDWMVRRGEFRLVYDHGSEYRGTLDVGDRCIYGVNLHADGREGEWTACY